jgi:hypothetical protein
MERAIRENDYVLVVCTPRYKRKADGRTGGTGYEGDVMTGAILGGADQRKFIPILRDGAWSEAAPDWMRGKYYIDLSAATYSEQAYQDLVATLRGERAEAPPVARGAGQQFRRIYYETFDCQHLTDAEVRGRLGDTWLIGRSGHWEGHVADGRYTLTNRTGPDAWLTSRMRYTESAGAAAELGDCKVSVRVRVEPPNDGHSGAGLLYRASPERDDYYSLLANAGGAVTLALTRGGRMSILWSLEVGADGGDQFTGLQIVGRGADVDLHVNGTRVHTVRDAVLRSGNPGFAALSIGRFVFDDFAIYQPV